MRVLVTSVPGYGHLLPLLPTATAARAAGAEVAVSTAASLAPSVGDLKFVQTGPELDEILAVHGRCYGTEADDPGIFSRTRVDLTFDAAAVTAKELRPDLIVADAFDLVAPLVAAAFGVPWVAHGVSIAFPAALSRAFRADLIRQADERGLRLRPRAALLEPWPRFLQPDGHIAPDDEIPLHSGPFQRPGAGPEDALPLRREGKRRVLITLGGKVDLADGLGRILPALSGVAADIVVTGDPAAVEGILFDPERVRFVNFAPLANLLEGVDAVVSVGGAGTVSAALSRGIPLVILPMMADQPLIAERVRAFGAGIVVDPRDAEDRLSGAVETVLENRSYRAAARAAATRIGERPSPEAAWAELLRRLA